MEAQGKRGIWYTTILRALVAAGCAGAALGCSDPRKAAEAITREKPAPLSLQAHVGPGAGLDGPARAALPASEESAEIKKAPEKAEATAEGEGAQDEGERAKGDDAAEAQPRRQRAASPARGGRRRPAGAAREPHAPAERAGGVDAGDVDGVVPGPSEAGQVPARPELKVTRLVVARGVSGREPVGVATSFPAAATERLYAFVALTNEALAASGIVVTFTPKSGGAPLRIKLDVGPERRWRTWALTRKVRAPGAWSVAVSDAGGTVLARQSFTITP